MSNNNQNMYRTFWTWIPIHYNVPNAFFLDKMLYDFVKIIKKLIIRVKTATNDILFKINDGSMGKLVVFFSFLRFF